MKRKNSRLMTAAFLLTAATVASAFEPATFYWSRTNYGTYSAYSGSRVGGWNLTNGAYSEQWVFAAGENRCPPTAAGNCTHTHTVSDTYTWSLATGVTYKQTIVPLVNELSITMTYTVGKSFTDMDALSTPVRPGQYSQYYRYMPRRYGNATIYGTRVATGRTKTVRKCAICVQKWTEWEYYDDPTKVASVMYGNKNTSSAPIATFRLHW
jgi:hypothetical protein